MVVMLVAVNLIMAYMNHTAGEYVWTGLNLAAALIVLGVRK